MMKKLLWTETILLFAGTVFAWTNFCIELNSWLQDKACSVGCNAGLANPFVTPCFYGAIFFLLAFVLSSVILLKFLKSQTK